MATYTERYNLKKPAGEDFYNIKDFNENMDKIAAALSNKTDKAVTGSLTLNKSSWNLSDSPTGEYTYVYFDRTLYGLTSKEVFDCVVDLASEEVAQDCGLAQYCKTVDGGVEFYAKSEPTADISIHYTIIEGV